MVQLSQPNVTTGKTIAFTIQTIISKVMSLLFNTLSRFVIAFLSRSSRLLITVETLNYQAWLWFHLEAESGWGTGVELSMTPGLLALSSRVDSVTVN